ncbi:hypothetical protein DBR42_17545 [Pelomonas sp. HMWF004]|nr:hypothetical protein DBR42_17545 [Pelomonas sp. HMWF004]
MALDAEAVERVIAADRQAEKPRSERLTEIRSAFNDLQPSYQGLISDLSGASLDQLRSLWRLSGFMAYATNEFSYAGAMMRVHDEYARRKILPPIELRQVLLESLIGFRQFDEARLYAAKAQVALEYIPRIEGAAQPSGKPLGILRVDARRGVLLRENLNLDDEVHVFVVGFIGCTFSRRAADAIERHDTLRRLMRDRSTWIVLPGPLYFSDVLAWNRDHPSTGFSYVDGMESWGFVDDWSTPTFYFVKRGKVVEKLKGWPDDAAGISALLEAMAAGGGSSE